MGQLFDDFGSYLELALTVLTLASIAGIGSLIGNVKNLREQVNDADKEAERFRKSRDEERAEREREKVLAEAERVAAVQKITECQAEIEVLRRTVTGEVHLVALGEQLDALAQKLNELTAHLTDHADALTKLQTNALDHWRTEIAELVRIRELQERAARDDDEE